MADPKSLQALAAEFPDAPVADTFAKIIQFWDNEDENGPVIPMDLHTACSCGEYSYVQELLDGGTDVNRPNVEHWTPLAYACYGGHDTVANLLIEQAKANVNAPTGSTKMTSMMWAAACNHEPVILSLLAYGANIEAEDEDGRTAVMWAIITDQKHTLLGLLENGADVEHPNKKTGRTPLLMAVADKNEALVDLLLQNDANVNAVDTQNRSAMYLAQQAPASTAILNLLEAAGRKDRGSVETVLRSEPGLSLGSLNLGGDDDLLGTASGKPRTASPASPKFQTMDGFLEYLNLQKYSALFKKKGITFTMVLDMDEANLKSIGLSLFGPRRKIYFAAQRWKEEHL